jgi:exosortase
MAIAVGVLGSEGLRPVKFPLGFLFCMVPLPKVAVSLVETVLQHSSGEVLAWLFWFTGIHAPREGLVFRLPTLVIEVAKECSGIHSTLVLIYTALVGGYFFLRDPWHRAILVAITIPLGILRNAFRIWVISWLCIHVSPDMIDSLVHRRGGPAFFALTMGVLALLIWALRRREGRRMEMRSEETHSNPPA